MSAQPQRRHSDRLTPAQLYVRAAVLFALPLALVALLPALYATYRVWEVADSAQRTAEENRRATCSFVADLRERYNSTARYIVSIERRELPPFPGVDLAALKLQQAGRRSTLDSFAGLECEPIGGP